MKKVVRRALAPAVLVTIAACASQAAAPAGAGPAASAPPAAAPAAPVSVYTGVFSAEQAERGNTIQRRECGSCHTPSDWGQGRLLAGWNGQSAYDLVSHIQNTMPLDAPGRLSFQQYTDIVAFIFNLNNIPAGANEMPADEAAQKNIEIEYRR